MLQHWLPALSGMKFGLPYLGRNTTEGA